MVQEQLISIQGVSQLTSLSVSSIRRLVKKGLFPSPIRLTERKIVWLKTNVIDWILEARDEEHGHEFK